MKKIKTLLKELSNCNKFLHEMDEPLYQLLFKNEETGEIFAISHEKSGLRWISEHLNIDLHYLENLKWNGIYNYPEQYYYKGVEFSITIRRAK